jgi:putative ABC transport system permease protein
LHNYKGTVDEAFADREYTTQKFIILGHVAIKQFSNADRTYSDYTFYLPAEIYKPMLADPAIMSYAFNVEDDDEKNMDQFLKDYTEKVEPIMNYDSKATMMSEFSGLRSSVVVIGGALSFIIGLVGILNFINSILTSILTRRKEFAMLQSIGMTRRQLRQMLCFEGLYYCVGTGIISILFGIAFSLMVVKSFCNLLWFFSFHFILWPILVILPILFLLGLIIPLVSYAATSKQSVV